jgi:hypothetical protein
MRVLLRSAWELTTTYDSGFATGARWKVHHDILNQREEVCQPDVEGAIPTRPRARAATLELLQTFSLILRATGSCQRCAG